MGLFDFLKKKEFEQINQLQGQLEKYKSITDIELEVALQRKLLDDLIKTKNFIISFWLPIFFGNLPKRNLS
jgi:hypothetical protein